MNRRKFIQTTAIAATAAATNISMTNAAEKTKGVRWPIGCFNRPWMRSPKLTLDYDAALGGIAAAGYKWTGLLTATEKEPFTGATATAEHLKELKKKIAAHGLKASMAALRTKNDLSLDGQIKDVRQQIDNGKFVGVEFLLTFGVDNAEHFENYIKVMRDAAAYSAERKLKLVLKPHGGESGGAEEILACMKKVSHPNFKIWFDAGNIIYYEGRDPLEQLKQLAEHVTGFCAKDCDKQKGSVWLQFGAGKVDFPAVFGELKKAGFNGPVMVECCGEASTAGEMTANARGNREYLEKLFASL